MEIWSFSVQCDCGKRHDLLIFLRNYNFIVEYCVEFHSFTDFYANFYNFHPFSSYSNQNHIKNNFYRYFLLLFELRQFKDFLTFSLCLLITAFLKILAYLHFYEEIFWMVNDIDFDKNCW